METDQLNEMEVSQRFIYLKQRRLFKINSRSREHSSQHILTKRLLLQSNTDSKAFWHKQKKKLVQTKDMVGERQFIRTKEQGDFS